MGIICTKFCCTDEQIRSDEPKKHRELKRDPQNSKTFRPSPCSNPCKKSEQPKGSRRNIAGNSKIGTNSVSTTLASSSKTSSGQLVKPNWTQNKVTESVKFTTKRFGESDKYCKYGLTQTSGSDKSQKSNWPENCFTSNYDKDSSRYKSYKSQTYDPFRSVGRSSFQSNTRLKVPDKSSPWSSFKSQTSASGYSSFNDKVNYNNSQKKYNSNYRRLSSEDYGQHRKISSRSAFKAYEKLQYNNNNKNTKFKKRTIIKNLIIQWDGEEIII